MVVCAPLLLPPAELSSEALDVVMFLSCQSQYTELLARRRWRISINLHLPKAFWKSTIHVRLSSCVPLTAAAAAAVRLLVCAAAAAVHTEETLPVGKDQTDAAAFTFYIYGRGQVVPINPKLLLLLLLRIRDLGK